MPTFTTDELISRAKTAADMHDNFVSPDEFKQWATQGRYSLDLLLARAGWHQNFATFIFDPADFVLAAQATFNTATDFSLGGALLTAVGPWEAILTATAEGSAGNNINLSIYQDDTAPGPTIEVRDNEIYNGVSWDPSPNTVGVLLVDNAEVLGVGDLEAAINASSSLLQVTTPGVDTDIISTFLQHDGITTGGVDGQAAGDYLYEAQEMMAVVAVHLIDSEGNVLGRLEYTNTVDFLRQLPGSTINRGRPTSYRTRREDADVFFNFYPEPQTGDLLLVTYVPAPKRLVLVSETPGQSTSNTVNYPMGWEEYIVLQMAGNALDKEESDRSAIDKRLAKMEAEITDLAWTRVLSEAPKVRNVDRRAFGTYDYPPWQSWAWL